MTAESLRSYTSKDLAQMAKEQGIPKWHSLRKEALIKELLKSARKSQSSKASKPKTDTEGRAIPRQSTARSINHPQSPSGQTHRRVDKPRSSTAKNGRVTVRHISKKEKPLNEPLTRVNSRVNKIIREQNEERQRIKDLARAYESGDVDADGVVLIVRDAYWLQACWSIQPQTIQRCQVALGDEWHFARPVIRLLAIQDQGSTHGVENVIRDVPIHGGVRNWYIDVENPPGEFRVALGYITPGGRFYHIAKSNIVSTPHPGKCDLMKGHWDDIADNYQKYFALSGGYSEGKAADELRDVFENQLQRPMNTPSMGHASSITYQSSFKFDVNAQVIVFGSVDPQAKITLAGDPVQVQPDGSFNVQLSLPDRRQVLPVVALSRDGSQQRTIVLAIEKNTKILEAINCDLDDA